MDLLAAFLLAIFLVGLMTVKMGLSPFLSLVVASLVYGFLSGMGPELIGSVATGLGRIFSALAVIVFSGSVIAEHLRRSGGVERVVSDLLTLVGRRGALASGLSGYLVTLPAMCSITSYLILEPVVREMGRKAGGYERRFLFSAAVFSIISFNLVYPSPVLVTLTGSLAVSPGEALRFGLTLSLLLFVPVLIWMARFPVVGTPPPSGVGPVPSRLLSWAPLILPLAMILLGVVHPPAWFLGSVDVALLTGALLSALLAKKDAGDMIKRATRRAGTIIFDLCGAGAFGYVVAQSGIGPELFSGLGTIVPVVVLPFLAASLIQLAQGSRVVTVVIAAEMMRGYPLEPVTLLFLIAAGAFTLSSFSDPYFWLVKETTGSDLKEALLWYTIPLTLCGLLVFAAAVLRWLFFI